MARYIIEELDIPMFEGGNYIVVGEYKELKAGLYLDSHGNMFCLLSDGALPTCTFMSFKSVYGGSLIEIDESTDEDCGHAEEDKSLDFLSDECTSPVEVTLPTISGIPESTFLKALAVVAGNAGYGEIK